ncbi:PhoX family protein [Marinobacter daepoensis]|uniref:alkaline phosphatase PhoX n=1 Tax=Marinobacter daepoensis TaxID=262077 RepID=UPI001C948D39|nr:PhoX family protein [Marinobacter daepoensis]
MALSRRQMIQLMFLGGSAAALSACGGGSSSPSLTGGSGNEKPNKPDPISPPDPVPEARELPLEAGPLADIGPLVDSGVDGILIPAGFSLRLVATAGRKPVSHAFGYLWHPLPDGGAVFPVGDGGWVYVSNSEFLPGGVGALRFGADGEIVDAYPILKNTRINCAGGATPWGTWLSCEEIFDGKVYECDPLGTPQQAQSYPALGLFKHEAAAVDMETASVFMTEDEGDGRLYRFVSTGRTSAINGADGLDLANGRLQVLEVSGYENGAYMEDLEAAREIHRVNWVDVQSPDRPQSQVRNDIQNSTGKGAPGTQFKGGEGIWIQFWPEGAQQTVSGYEHPLRAVVFFACKRDNRVYALDVDNDLIEVVFDNAQLEGSGEAGFDDVDNLVVSPAGDVVVAEDGDAMRLMVMVPNQPARILLQVPGGGSELTGPAFTPDGSRLYFSSQRAPSGLTGLMKLGRTYELTVPEAFR